MVFWRKMPNFVSKTINKTIMNKTIMNWVMAATLVCGASVLTSCKTTKEAQVQSTELIRTS